MCCQYAEVARLENEVSSVAERLRKLVAENARMCKDQAQYQQEYDALVNEYDRVNAQIQVMENHNRNRERAKRKLEIFLHFMEKEKLCKATEPYTFATLVEKVVIRRDRTLQFCFRNGMRCGHRLIKRPAIREQSSASLKNCRNLRAGVE